MGVCVMEMKMLDVNPDLLAIAKKGEKTPWEMGDALLRLFPIKGKANNGITKAIENEAKALEQRGYDDKAKSLINMRAVSHAFPPQSRQPHVGWTIHRDAKTPDRLAHYMDSAKMSGKDFTISFVRASNKSDTDGTISAKAQIEKQKAKIAKAKSEQAARDAVKAETEEDKAEAEARVVQFDREQKAHERKAREIEKRPPVGDPLAPSIKPQPDGLMVNLKFESRLLGMHGAVQKFLDDIIKHGDSIDDI